MKWLCLYLTVLSDDAEVFSVREAVHELDDVGMVKLPGDGKICRSTKKLFEILLKNSFPVYLG